MLTRMKIKSMRQEFADTMLEVGQRDKNLIVLIGDISHFILQPFAKMCPGRFYNIGICEPTIMNMAAGLSKVGFFPVVHTITPFLIERSFEQIKLDFGYQRLGVNIVTVGSAFDYTGLGCTHHCYDDFALIKSIENSQIIYPGSPIEFQILFKETYSNTKITYFRIPEHQHSVVFQRNQIKFGKGITVREGKNLTIIAVGPQLKTALDSVYELKNMSIDPEILYFSTIKPLDIPLIRKSVSKTKRCLVIEEHGKYGGVFDDVLRNTHDLSGIRFGCINAGEKFIHEYGTYREICEMLGFSTRGIVSKVKKELIKTSVEDEGFGEPPEGVCNQDATESTAGLGL